jgi:hypothetical protein
LRNAISVQGQTVQGQTVQGQTVQGQTVQGQTVQGQTVLPSTDGKLSTDGKGVNRRETVNRREPTRVEITQPVETKRHLFRIHYRFTHISLGSGKKESLPAANMGIGWRRQVEMKQMSNSETCRRYISK